MAQPDVFSGRSGEDPALITMRARFQYAMDGWRQARAERKTDMLYVSGNPWDAWAQDRDQRKQAGRPYLALDELGQYFNQVINDVRSNKRAVKFDPVGDGANDATAQFYQDKMREIEYRSHAQFAYTTAFENAVQGSYGWCRLKLAYADDESDDQDLEIVEVVNPDNVLPDPDGKRPDSSDITYLFYFEQWPRREFLAKFPEAQSSDFNTYALSLPLWVTDEFITVAEYWTVTTTRVDAPHLKRKFIEKKTVTQQLTNGIQFLGEKTTWPGKYIPFASCYGKILYVDEGSGVKRQLLSMTRLARGPQMLYNYYRTTQAELVGMTPRTPVVGYEGQFRGHESEWQNASHAPVAFLQVRATTEATGPQNVLPLPQRQVYDPPLERFEIGAEGARRAIQSAMGVSALPTQAQKHNEKSGVALKQIEQTQQQGSFHFKDHFYDMVRFVGVMVEDLLDKVIDVARDVAVRKANDTTERVRVNDPNAKEPVYTKGRHNVTVSTGMSYESERQAGSDFADTLVGLGDPVVQRAVLPVAIKLKNLGAIGDELVEIAKALQPPEVQQLEGDGPDPQQMRAMLGQAKQQIQHAEQAIEELSKKAEGHQIAAQAKLQEAEIRSRTELEKQRVQGLTDLEKTRMDNATRIAVAEIAIRGKGVVSSNEAQMEAIALHHAQAHESALSAQEHAQGMEQQEAAAQHAAAMAASGAEVQQQGAEADRAFQGEQSDADREAAAEQAAQSQEASE